MLHFLAMKTLKFSLPIPRSSRGVHTDTFILPAEPSFPGDAVVEVFDEAGVRVGHVSEVFMDHQTGEASFTVKVG